MNKVLKPSCSLVILHQPPTERNLCCLIVHNHTPTRHDLQFFHMGIWRHKYESEQQNVKKLNEGMFTSYNFKR